MEHYFGHLVKLCLAPWWLTSTVCTSDLMPAPTSSPMHASTPDLQLPNLCWNWCPNPLLHQLHSPLCQGKSNPNPHPFPLLHLILFQLQHGCKTVGESRIQPHQGGCLVSWGEINLVFNLTWFDNNFCPLTWLFICLASWFDYPSVWCSQARYY